MKRTLSVLLFACLGIFSGNSLHAQLVAGDIAFTGYNAETTPATGGPYDSFSFVVLRVGGLPANTVINFTDCGWVGTTACGSDQFFPENGVSEATLTWQSPGSVLAYGTQVVITGPNASAGTVTSPGTTNPANTGLSFTVAGDQIIAFQGTRASNTIIAAIHANVIAGTTTDAGWDVAPAPTGTSNSTIPPCLTNGVNAVIVYSGANIASAVEMDNARLTCFTATGNRATDLAYCNNRSNWVLDDVTAYSLPAGACTTPLSATQSQVNLTCNGVCTGQASVVASGGTAPYTYAWSPSGGSGATASSLCASNYTCTITDAASSVITKTFSITQPPAIVITPISQTNVACNGGANGAAQVSSSGGTGTLTYNWTPGNPTGDGTGSVSGLTAGVWTVTVTDANSCTGNRTFNITAPTAIVVNQVSQTNVACFGGSTGAAQVSASGGTPGYTYSWAPSGGTAASTTGRPAGSYTCTVTDANGCTKASSAFNITQPTSNVSGTTVVTNVACFGGNTGAINLTPTGGTPGYTFNWLPSGPTTEDRTGLVAGTYSVQITDANGCTGTVNATVTQPASNVSGTTVVTNVACFGGNTGAINLTPTGGTGPYTFNWLPSGPTTEDRTGLVAGTYSVQITDANGCTGTVNATVTQPASNVSGTTVVTNVACFGGNTGAINLTPTGGVGPYTFNWLPSGPTTEDRTSLVAGTYSVQITDANGCTGTVNATVTQPASNVSGTTVVTNVACFGGNTGAINLTPTGGVGPYTFNWLPSGPTTEDRTSLVAGTYSVQITDANGCTGTVNATVTQPASNVSGTTVVTNVACFGGNTGAINLTPTGGVGPYTFNWLPSGPTTEDRTSLVAGTYSVQITDANGCTGTVNATVTQPASNVSGTTVVTNVACFGGNTGAINLTPTGGTGPYTFNWLPSGPTTEDRTGLVAGTYSVQITDANGCTGTVNATVTQPASNVSGTTVVTNVACFGGNTGAINLTPTGGTGPYTFNWLPSGPTTEDRTSLVAGTYSVQITDANGCTGTVNATVTQPASNVSGTTVVTNVACFGGNTGAINLTPTGGTGPYTFNWLPSGPTTEDRTNLVAGTYSVQITDANGCTGTVNATVTQPSSNVSGTTVVTNVACFGGNTGAINLTPTGGVGPYTFNWLPSGPTTEDRTNLVAGTYSVQITDANGCTGTVNATVTQPSSNVSGTTVVTNVACFGGNTGAINLTPTGGVGPYTFNWLPSGPTTEDRTNLVAGTYSVQITDANGCTGTVNATVTQPTSPVSGTTVVTNVACFGGTTGAIDLTPTGGTPGYTYNWGGGITTQDRTNLAAGTYTVIITDANGCTGSVNATVTQLTAISTSTSVTNVSCNGGSNGVASVSASGGAGGYTYSWTPSGGTSATATGLSQGNYTVTVTDANSCTKTAFVNVTQPTALVANSTASSILCNGGMSTVTVTASGGTAAYTGTGTFTAMAGPHTYTVTDANGCPATTSVSISEPTVLSASSAASSILCNGGMSTVTVTANGGTAAYTGTGTFTAIAGPHTYTVTDANGCSATTSVSITEPTVLSAGSAASSILCNGGVSSITVTANGGTPSYTGIGTFTANAGTQTYTVTDANGCVATTSVNITEPAAITSSLSFTLCQGQSVTVGTSTYSAAGTFTDVIASLLNGCDSTITTNIMINTLPNITVNSGAICAGESFTLVPNGAVSYTYSSGSDVITPSSTDTYTVTGTDANGCVNSAVSSVTVNTLPTLSVISATICAGATGTLTASGADTYTWSTGSNSNEITDNPASTAVYTVSGTSLEGCPGSAVTATITVGAAPAIVVNSESICAGGSATLTASGVTTYTWSTGENTSTIIVSPSTSTVYVVNGDLAGCSVQAGNTATVTVNALPSIGATTNNTLLCAGETATLSATGAVSYTWSTSENTADIAVSPTSTETYTVEGTDANGCSNTTTVTQDVSPCTGIASLAAAQNNIVVYPNPNNGQFSIELTTNAKVVITNAIGQVIVNENMASGKHELDIHNQADGVYFVKVIENNKQHTVKLIKK